MFNSYSVNTLRLDPERCVGCTRCVEVCPHGVFAVTSHRAKLARPEDCMECGACALNCPVQAIEVESGVGCAYALIRAVLTGSGVESCDCGGGDDACGDESAVPSACCGDR